MVLALERPTIAAVAKLVGRSVETLHKYQRNDKIDIHDVDAVRAHIATLQPPPRRGASMEEGGEDLREQKLRAEVAKLNEEVRAKSIDNEVREGSLVSRRAVESWLMNFANATRAKLESFPGLVIPELPDDVRVVCHEIIDEQVRMLLTSLSEMPSEMWGDETIKDTDV